MGNVATTLFGQDKKQEATDFLDVKLVGSPVCSIAIILPSKAVLSVPGVAGGVAQGEMRVAPRAQLELDAAHKGSVFSLLEWLQCCICCKPLMLLQKRASRQQVKASSFNKLLLRFGHLNRGFAKCKKVFHSLDNDGNEVIDLQELAEGCHKLGFDISTEVVDKVFHATDLDGNKSIDFREFIVVLAVLYMISTEVRSTLPMDALTCFKALIDLDWPATGWRQDYQP